MSTFLRWRDLAPRVSLPWSDRQQEAGNERRRDDRNPSLARGCRGAGRRLALGRYVSRMLQGARARDLLVEAIAEAKPEARPVGLTDADIDAELAAYNAERRD